MCAKNTVDPILKSISDQQKGAKCLLFGITKDMISSFAVTNSYRFTFVP